MNLASIDLNLLPILDALLSEVHITRAAARVGLSQPAMSNALNRLRAHFNDRLLVRSGSTMVLTPKAEAMREPLQNVLRDIRHHLLETRAFVARDWEQTFRVGINDYTEGIFFSDIAVHLERFAPRMRLIGTMIDRSVFRDLSEGKIDLAMGYFPECPAGIYRRHLFKEEFVTVVRKDHPTIRETLDLELFLEAGHLLISPAGDLKGVVDRHLQDRKRKRKIRMAIAHFQIAPDIIARTDFIATIPKRIAVSAEGIHPLRCFEPPLPVPGFEVSMIWHERSQGDQACRWLRTAIIELAATQT